VFFLDYFHASRYRGGDVVTAHRFRLPCGGDIRMVYRRGLQAASSRSVRGRAMEIGYEGKISQPEYSSLILFRLIA
jgi:hypothetical protein